MVRGFTFVVCLYCVFFNDTSTTKIYTYGHTPSLHDALPISSGVKAAFITSAGYGEAGEAGIEAQEELKALAAELGILVAGPNGQGVVSTPARLCAQIVAPIPPPGRIGVASQSGNFVSSFENYAVQTGVGISRAVSAGNAINVTVQLGRAHV